MTTQNGAFVCSPKPAILLQARLLSSLWQASTHRFDVGQADFPAR